MKCPHCKQGTLVRDNWYYNHAVKCQICGYWEENAAPAKMEKFGREAWIEAGAKSNKDQRPVKVKEFIACPVVGCSGKMMRSNPNGMCGACNSLLRNWENSKRTNPAPVQKDSAGVWHRVKKVYEMEDAA